MYLVPPLLKGLVHVPVHVVCIWYQNFRCFLFSSLIRITMNKKLRDSHLRNRPVIFIDLLYEFLRLIFLKLSHFNFLYCEKLKGVNIIDYQ